MLILTFKLPNRKKCLLAAGAAAVLLTGALLCAMSRSASRSAMALREAEYDVCITCLEKFGWQVEPTPVSTETFTLSQALTEDYLDLQIQAGFDLGDDMGCAVTRYTFLILNYPTGEVEVYADVLVRDGAVVGGDVRTSDLNGFLHSLLMPT